jgi:hypothetical protein
MRPNLLSSILLSLLTVGVLGGCRRDPQAGLQEVKKAYIGPEITTVAPSDPETSRRACERLMRDVLAEPAVPGAPAFEAERAELLARAKAEPVYFTRTPDYGTEAPTLTVKGYRAMLAEGNPYGTVQRIIDESVGFPKQARDALLKDGYLYAERPELAYALVSLVQPHQLFGHDRIWIQRGEQLIHAERRNGRYYYVDGSLEGQRARLLLFDRAGGSETPPEPLHRDFRGVRYRLHFDRMQIRHVTETHVVANLHYGKWWVPSVLSTTGASAELECEVLDESLQEDVATWRKEGERRERVVQGLRRAMLAELDEALPFDEPLHEYGFQLDGTLRKKWNTAYLQRRDRFALNGDAYQVFDPKGRPLTPQVCVDFLTDTLERTSGTWFKPRGDKPGRAIGKLDFDALAGKDREELRRVPGFVAFARSHPDWFEVKDDTKHVELGDRKDFFAYLAANVDDFAPGDAILIKGKTPWDANHVHFHSFFVYESDPVTGMPIVVVGNAGRPTLRSWETEVKRTPARSIVHRIRFQTAWLEKIIGVEPLTQIPPLAAGPE